MKPEDSNRDRRGPKWPRATQPAQIGLSPAGKLFPGVALSPARPRVPPTRWGGSGSRIRGRDLKGGLDFTGLDDEAALS